MYSFQDQEQLQIIKLFRSSQPLHDATKLDSHFSPSGKLVQIEYALAAVAAGAPSVGIKGNKITSTEFGVGSGVLDLSVRF